MDREIKRKQSFLLRLPVSLRDQATEIAHEDGTSLNHFISLALAEKISRMEKKEPTAVRESSPVSHRPTNYLQNLRFPRSA